ncbi:MAG: transglutaminase family protein, partial [Hyphomicrobium sp.]
MKIRIGFDLVYECAEETPMILMLSVHPSRARDLLVPDALRVYPLRAVTRYNDKFGNICTRIVAPAGETRLMADAMILDSGK